MTSTRRLASALCWALCFSGYSSAQDITTQTHNISDDGYANVPLQFDFSFYGQTFNNSWMFSNGIISFQDPVQSGLDWSNLGVQNFSTTMGSQYNYSIFPLWTDLINIVGSFTTEGNADFQRYNWIGISPFYDSTRLNTFSVEIRPDGQIIANYSLINVDYGVVGVVGNSSQGEFQQLHSSPGTISDWNLYTHGSEPPPQELEPSPQVITVTPMVEIVETNTGVEATPIQATQSGAANQSMEITQVATARETAQSSGSGINLTRVLGNIAREQARIGALERSTVESSVEQSALQALQATQDAESIAAGVQAESIAIGIITQESSRSGGAASNFSSSDSASSSASLSGFSGLRGADAQSVTESQNEGTRNETVSVSGFTAVDLLQEQKTAISEEAQRDQKTQTVRQDIPNNDLAGGVTLASLGATPPGFQAYSIGMPDAQFYAPREIYRNQRTVDNPAGRRLFGGSDRLHQDLVDQQYKR